MKTRVWFACATVLLWLAFSGSAAATTCTASVLPLSITGVDTLAGEAATGSTTITIDCSEIDLLGVRVCPYLGDGSGGRDASSRYLQGPSASFAYQLFTDASHATVWGNPSLGFGSFPTVDFPGNLAGNATGHATLTIYAQLMPGPAPVPAGTYTSDFTAADTDFQYGPNVLNLISCSGIQLLTSHINPTFTVSATVDKKCLIEITDIDFGAHGVLSSAVTAEGSIAVQCTPDTGYAIGLDNGMTGSGPTSRLMTRGSESVSYGLYKDAARTDPWGDAEGAGLSGSGTGDAVTFDVFGKVPAQPTPSPGRYQDTVVATVTY